ncbi:hypothetical protein PanWU01x14_309000 [Parasponia andersonii]|uniref:Uncharacterized protein n=1 Tax=Parasponia andersonii TaxID=3476 RepID=A0A2P5AQV8_PARAD|nr:hypothetical protein PanWU01x14_309000 [Parasponia andersonii]
MSAGTAILTCTNHVVSCRNTSITHCIPFTNLKLSLRSDHPITQLLPMPPLAITAMRVFKAMHERWALRMQPMLSLHAHNNMRSNPTTADHQIPRRSKKNDVARYVCHENPMILVGEDSRRKCHANCCVCQSRWSGLA